MDRLDFYKDFYYKELDRKKSLNDMLSLPMAIIIGLISWQFYFFNSFFLKDGLHIPLWVVIITIAALVLVAICIICLLLSYYKPNGDSLQSGYDYNYIGLPNEYDAHYQVDPAKGEELLIKHYVICTSHNIKLNEEKTAWIVRAKISLVFSLFVNFIMVLYPIFYYKEFIIKNTTQKIQIVDTVKILPMSTLNDPNKNTGNPQTPAPVPVPPQQTPAVPVEPKIRVIPETKIHPEGGKLNE